MSSDRIVVQSGNKVDLVILEECDIPLFFKWMNDVEVTQYLLSQTPLMLTHEKEWFEKLAKNWETNQVFGITLKDGQLIGNLGLHRIDHRHGTCTAGAFIGEKEYWGKGYGSEAEGLLVNYAFSRLNLRKICSSVFSHNERSLKAALKNGAVEEGRRRAQFIVGGKPVDEIMLAVFRDSNK